MGRLRAYWRTRVHSRAKEVDELLYKALDAAQDLIALGSLAVDEGCNPAIYDSAHLHELYDRLSSLQLDYFEVSRGEIL